MKSIALNEEKNLSLTSLFLSKMTVFSLSDGDHIFKILH